MQHDGTDDATRTLPELTAFLNYVDPDGVGRKSGCDVRSDCVIRQFPQGGRTRHWYLFRHNPAHRWYHFPRLECEDALLLKCDDSCDDGRTRFAAHTAFLDPTSPADAPARESVDVRTLALF